MSVPDGTHDDPGRRITARIQVLARGDVNDPSSQVHNLIGARIVALLDHGHATLDPFVTGATVWMAHHLESRKMPDADRTVRRRMDRVDLWTSPSEPQGRDMADLATQNPTTVPAQNGK